MSDGLELVRRGRAGAGRVLLLLPGFGDEPDVFVDHHERIDPEGDWLVVVARPRLTTRHGPIWYRVGEHGPDPDQLAGSVAAVAATLGELAAEAAAEPGALVLGGFSQGGALSLAVLCDPTAGPTPAAVGVLAGYLPERPDHLVDLDRATGVDVLVAHGRDDELVDPLRGRSAARALARRGAEVTSADVDGGHRVGPALLDPLAAWLAARVGR